MTSTTIVLTVAGILALTGVTLLVWVVIAAYLDSPKQGALSTFVPGYALFYGWTKMSHPRHRWIVAGALVAFVVAGTLATFATSFAPDAPVAAGSEVDDPEGWDAFADLEAPLND